ncbi:MAG: mannitol dehydrogenase family protein [archaeon]|nr:mannitol dehydrogenase family protein [archaeon]
MRGLGGVAVPEYDRRQLEVGIVHLGFGGFHRAHLARYTSELMEEDFAGHRQWAILGVGLLPSDERMYEALTPQDGLYTLVERDGQHAEAVKVVGSVKELLFAGGAEEGHGGTVALLERVAQPQVKIVSLTVTENGYCLNPGTKRLDLTHPRIAADLKTPRSPKTPVGIIVESYRRRREAGLPAFTALSCDNIQHNGDLLKSSVLAFASALDTPPRIECSGNPLGRRPGAEGDVEEGLTEWISIHGRFPNSMVDRITPLTTPADVEALRASHGIADRWPVVCEAFTQFVVEDCFADGRPQWERVGVQFVPDVTPYEVMKLRLLNGSHLAVATLGDLAGFTYIDECMSSPLLSRYMQALMDRETGETLLPVPGVDLPAYKRTLISRFSNVAIKDTVLRVATDAPLATILASVTDLLRLGKPFPLCALCLAAWCRRVAGGLDDAGRQITVKHPLAEQLRAAALEGGSSPIPILSIDSLFGSLKDHPALVDLVSHLLKSLYDHGALATLQSLSQQYSF